jgi:hypothetical protein
MTAQVNKSSEIWNEDLAPTDIAHRTWMWVHYARLWIGIVICIPAYLLASSLIDGGMSAVQAIGVILLGNLIIVIPLILVGHAGAKYGTFRQAISSGSRPPTRREFSTSTHAKGSFSRAAMLISWFGIPLAARRSWSTPNSARAISIFYEGRIVRGIPTHAVSAGRVVREWRPACASRDRPLYQAASVHAVSWRPELSQASASPQPKDVKRRGVNATLYHAGDEAGSLRKVLCDLGG